MVALTRVSVMEIALVGTLVVYVQPFIQARRTRKTAGACVVIFDSFDSRECDH